MSKLVGSVEWAGPTPHVADKNWEEYLGCRGPPEEGGVPAPYQASQPRVPVPEREVPISPGCENQQVLRLREMEGL